MTGNREVRFSWGDRSDETIINANLRLDVACIFGRENSIQVGNTDLFHASNECTRFGRVEAE
jgi:hypothetical protein